MSRRAARVRVDFFIDAHSLKWAEEIVQSIASSSSAVVDYSIDWPMTSWWKRAKDKGWVLVPQKSPPEAN